MFHNVSPWLRGGTVSTETIQRLVILRPIVDKQGHKAFYADPSRDPVPTFHRDEVWSCRLCNFAHPRTVFSKSSTHGAIGCRLKR
jgi:hypothetical protein